MFRIRFRLDVGKKLYLVLESITVETVQSVNKLVNCNTNTFNKSYFNCIGKAVGKVNFQLFKRKWWSVSMVKDI